MLYYHIFMFLWTLYFLLGINHVTMAGAFATWYWTMDKTAKLSFPVLKSFARTIFFHTGSIAVGSFLIALVELLRVILYQLQRRVNKGGPQALKYLFACLQCCTNFLSVITKYINRNAYIFIAIKGLPFFQSARDSTTLLLKHAAQTISVNFVSDFVFFFSKLIVTGVMALFAYMYLVYQGHNLGVVNVPIFTAFLVGVEAFIIASAFFSVYQMAVDTIFLSFLLDLEQNDGSPFRPYYMTDQLKKILSVSNKQVPKGRKISTIVESQEIYDYDD